MNANQLEKLRALPDSRSDEAYLLNWLYEPGLSQVRSDLAPTTETVITARLGTRLDGMYFTLAYYPTCYRRGPWRLTVSVNVGPGHELWGCFDEADQPQRNYHDKTAALSEADKIAFVLIKDRVKRGPIKDTNPPGDPDNPLPSRNLESDDRQSIAGPRQEASSEGRHDELQERY